MRLLEDAPEVNTNIRAFVYDSDAVSSYPSCTQVGNVAKVTTRKEVCKIGNFDEDHFRRQNLGLVIGETNALEYSIKMFGAPTLFDLQQRYVNRNITN